MLASLGACSTCNDVTADSIIIDNGTSVEVPGGLTLKISRAQLCKRLQRVWMQFRRYGNGNSYYYYSERQTHCDYSNFGTGTTEIRHFGLKAHGPQ